MNSTNPLERCLSFISCQLQPAALQPQEYKDRQRFSAVTISRQAGAGGHSIAQELAQYLEACDEPRARPWVVLDRGLVEKALEDHNLPARLARFLPEDRISQISDTMDELFGLHPPSWLLVRKTSETILHLAELGHVILLGRGSNVITSKLPQVFHVRLVGSLSRRLKRLQETQKLGYEEARKLAEREDLARARYLRQFFDKNIDDPLLYHLVINTDLISFQDAAHTIVSAMTTQANVQHSIKIPARQHSGLEAA